MTRQTMLALNFIAYQIAWFACVLGAAHGAWWLGPVVAVPLAVWHVYAASNRTAELSLLLVATVAGSFFDQIMLTAGWVHYPASPWPASVLPVWMMSLWLSFATTLNVSTRWLRKRPIFSAALGAIGGPLAYGGGVKLGAMTWSPAHPVPVALCIGIGLLMPLLFKIAERFDGFKEIT